MSATSSSEGTNQFGLSTDAQIDVAMDNVNSSKMRSKASDASVQGVILFLLLKLGFTGKLYPMSWLFSLYCELLVSLTSKILLGTFRFQDENKYEILLPVFSLNTWRIYNLDDWSYSMLAV